jgi:hypothetical protein
MENFECLKFIKLETDAPAIITVSKASSKDHSDVHYLFKLRKAVSLLAGEESMKGFTEANLKDLHISIVRSMIEGEITHWYEEWEPELDDSLPDELKLASSGYFPKNREGIFNLEDDELVLRKVMMDYDVLHLWSAPTARKNVPASHFLDQKNKKYPYKNSDGTINCGGLMSAYKAARGARGAPKRPEIAAKAARLLKSSCNKDVGGSKKTEELSGHLTKL